MLRTVTFRTENTTEITGVWIRIFVRSAALTLEQGCGYGPNELHAGRGSSQQGLQRPVPRDVKRFIASHVIDSVSHDAS